MTVTYSLNVANAKLTGFSKLLTRWKGSIYKLLYREMAIYISLYYSLSFIYRYILNNQQREKFEKMVLYCETFTNMVPLTFVLGFYVSIVVTRWWQQFMMIPWPDKSVMLITGCVHGNDERGRMIRRTLARYLLLMMTLTCQAVSTSVRRRFPTVDHIMEAGIMTKEERVIYDSIPGSHGKWWTPCAWYTTLVVRARKEGRIKDDVLLAQILDELHVFRNLCGMMFSYDWISIPLVYTQTVTIATYTYFLATVMGRQYLDPVKGYSKHDIDLYIPVFTIFEFFFFMGWLKVAEQLINPYGEDDDDFELNWCLDRNLIVSNWVVDELHNKAPKLVKDMYWDDQVPILPYTKSSLERKKGLGLSGPHLGSTANLEILPEEADFVPMETIMEEETQMYSSPGGSNSSRNATSRPNIPECITVTNSTSTVVPNESDSQKGLWMGSRIFNMLIGQSNQSLNTTSRVSDSTRSLFKGSKANIAAPFILKTPKKRHRTTSMRTNSSMQVSHPGGDHFTGSMSSDLPTAPVILPSNAEQNVSINRLPSSRVNELRSQPGPDGFRFPASYSPSLATLRRNSRHNSSVSSRKSSEAESDSIINCHNVETLSNGTVDSATSEHQHDSQSQLLPLSNNNQVLNAADLPEESLYEPEPNDVVEPATTGQSNRSSDESLTFTESNQSTVRSISELISKNAS